MRYINQESGFYVLRHRKVVNFFLRIRQLCLFIAFEKLWLWVNFKSSILKFQNVARKSSKNLFNRRFKKKKNILLSQTFIELEND